MKTYLGFIYCTKLFIIIIKKKPQKISHSLPQLQLTAKGQIFMP